MSMRKYIGERYVPIFGRVDETSIEWDNTKPYEPLTVVLYQGASYTSRQYVPVGVPIANEEFWALTGNYNAQVEQYRQEVLAFDDRITANSDAIADFNRELGSFEEETRDAIRENAENIDKYAYPKNNPIYYGADPTGNIESSAAINDCINANKGGIVIFTPGVYRVNNPINTPQRAKDRVSIDFNGATIEVISSTEYVLGIGYGDTSTDSEAGILRTFYKNGVIKNNSSCPVCIKTKAKYKNLAISQMNILGFKNAVCLGDATEITPCDAQITDCYFRFDDMTVNSIGILFNSSDSKINNCRIYGFKYALYFNATGNFITNVHCLPKGEPTPETLENSAFAYSAVSGENIFNLCYCDTYGAFIKYAANTVAYMRIESCKFYSYRNDYNQTFIDCSEITNFVHGYILNNYVTFNGDNDNQTFKAPSGNLRSTFTKTGLVFENNKLDGKNWTPKYGDVLTLKSKTQNTWYANKGSVPTDTWYLLCAIPIHRNSLVVGLDVKIPFYTQVIDRITLNFNPNNIRKIDSTQTNQTFTYGYTIDSTTFSYPIALVYIRRTTEGGLVFPITVECDNYGVVDTPILVDVISTTTTPDVVIA